MSEQPTNNRMTDRAKKVLELSLREALQLGHNYIGTEHILLGLIREGEGVAAKALGRLGVEEAELRKEVIKLLSTPSPPPTHSERLTRLEQIVERLSSGRGG